MKIKGKTKRSFSDREDLLIKRHKGDRKISKGEAAVYKVLSENHLRFHTEFYFNELKNHLFFFDFYLPDYNMVIEFDGEQHYTRKFNGKPMKNSERNDFLKTAFCRKNGIKLLRIKYDQIENVEQIIFNY